MLHSFCFFAALSLAAKSGLVCNTRHAIHHPGM
jgi:hypothetical protein